MDFSKELFVSLLLVVVFTVSNYAQSPTKETDFDYLKNCDETQTDEFISLLRNITIKKLPYISKKLIVLTDSEEKIYGPLRKKLEEDKSIFLPFHRTFNNDLEVTFITALLFRYVSHVKFLIHANSIDNAVNIFENLTRIFPNTIVFDKNIAFALTISENKNVSELMMEKLVDVAEKSNRSDVLTFLKNDKLPIAVFGNKPLVSNQNVEEFVSRFMNDNIKDQKRYLYFYYKFNFSQQYEKLIKCTIEFVNKNILTTMKTYAENLNLSLGLLEHSPENVTYYPKSVTHHPENVTATNIWSFIKSNTANDVKNYLNRFTDFLEDVKYKWQKEIIWSSHSEKASKSVEDSFEKLLGCFRNAEYQWIFPELDELTFNIKAMTFLWYYGNLGAFPEIALNWIVPLESASQKYIKNLQNFYHRTKTGHLLRRKVEQSCIVMSRKYKLSITGNVVKLSDIVFSKCRQFPQVIELFALEKAIIDQDLILIGKEVQLVIIAPKWEVVSSEAANPGRRLFNLSGSNGANFTEVKAKNGTTDGNRNGAHGLAGKPGGPAGSFYGIADEIINVEQLTILANGGRGGNGQNGGHGAEGGVGLTYKGLPSFKCGEKVPEFETSFERDNIANIHLYYQIRYDYKIFGRTGNLGGRGGNGGARGTGGKKGRIIIKELLTSNENRFQSSAVNGEEGSSGTGGNAGLGGKNGKTVTVACFVAHGSKIVTPANQLQEIDSDTGRGQSGFAGRSGISLKNRTISVNPQIEESFPSIVNRYKIYLRSYLANLNFTAKDMLWSFYNSLNTRENITNMYNALSLVEDFIGLEKQFFSLNNQINFTSSYQYLKKRIETYAENPNEDEDTEEYRQILKDLKDDIEDRFDFVKSVLWYYDVETNIQKQANYYLLRSVEKLKDFNTINNVLLLQKNKINLLDDAIIEGEDLIANVAQTYIYNLEETLDQELDSLLKEITEMEQTALEHKDELLKNREKLQITMKMKAVFGVFKVGCGILGIINPALGFATAAATSAITVIEAKTTDYAEAQVAVIPKSFEILANGTEKYFTAWKEKQEKIIQEQEKYVNNIKESATPAEVDIINQVWDSTKELREDDKPETVIKNSGQAMMQEYTHQETELTANLRNETNQEKMKAIETGLKLAKYLKVTSEVCKTGSETVLSIMKDSGKIKEIDVALNKSRNTLDTLHSMEINMYSAVEPMLNDMKTHLLNVDENLKNMNEFQQVIAKWNVTRTIEDVKRILNNVTKTLKVNEDINWTLGGLIKTYDLLFEMHEFLLKNKEKQQDKIDETNLHIAHASNLQISDSQLRYALSELQVVSSTNHVAEKYHEWISAVRQFAFPYSGEKLKDVKDLDEFQSKGLSEFNKFVVENIEQIIQDSDSEILIDPKGKTLFRGSNVPDDRENFSFYVWKNGDNKQAIKNILNGIDTKLFADIQKNDLRVDAVKFNRVKLSFTFKNLTIQTELSEELKNFDVKMTHHGDSKYKFGNFIYEIRNTPTTLKFNYDVDYLARETHIVTRLSYAPYMLSPYATWSIQLLPIKLSRNFESLQKYVEFVDLELIGNAEYFDGSQCDSTCETAMREHYTVATG